ncbi:MAG: hypothetical protein ACRD8W_21260 [Nitrososphaeraceae archaeon]
MSKQLSSHSMEHGLHLLNMSQTEYVKVQKHCRNQSFLITVPFAIAKAISISKGDVMKTFLEGNRVILEKV